MVAIVFEIARKALIALLIVFISGIVADDLLRFGESAFQATIVWSFFVYCFLALFCTSKYRLFHVLSIPVFTQFIHLFQKYAFPAGANSVWRLLPFILLVAYFFLFFLKTNFTLPKKVKLFLLTWISFQFFFLCISPNLLHIALGGFLLFLILLPLYFLYLYNLTGATDFSAELEKYMCLLFIILGLGTFGLIIAGAAYKGSDNLLATRNISDTNVTMAYFILMWPFALLYFRRLQLPNILLLTLLLIFSGVVVFSFSRGAVFIIFPYLIISVSVIFRTRQFKWFAVTALVLFLFSAELVTAFQNLDLDYFWTLRFSDGAAPNTIVQRLQTISGRAEIHKIAYHLFLKSPLFGHGTGSFEVLGPGYREAHSLFYTLLTEQGLFGTLYMYSILATLAFSFPAVIGVDKKYSLLLVSLFFYLIFNHTVGSVFVLIPAKSLTINCIAPVLLLCLYFYGRNIVAENA